MAAPTPEQINRLGPVVNPFKRRYGEVRAGEDIPFNDHIFDGTNGGSIPSGCLTTDIPSIYQRSRIGRYLWVIDELGLKIMLEDIANPFSIRGYMCHTNITGGKPALQGGELWFGKDEKVYINYSSGRYGAVNNVQEEAVIEYFTSLGYDVVQLAPR